MSLGLMLLVEDGKVKLADPVSKFLPNFKGVTGLAMPRSQ
jgi:CubicO group peptidase (beta-lactamase class C family)